MEEDAHHTTNLRRATNHPRATNRRRYAAICAAWVASVAASFVLGGSVSTYLILAHGLEIGAPLMVVGAKLVTASEPAFIEGVTTIAPLPGELDPLPASREVSAPTPREKTKLARR